MHMITCILVMVRRGGGKNKSEKGKRLNRNSLRQVLEYRLLTVVRVFDG